MTDQHITVLRALIASARAANCDVGMDASVLAALLNERDQLRALIDKIAALADDGGNWEHIYDGDDNGEWIDCRGRETVISMIEEYRLGPEPEVTK